jgi:Mce-associated membrane protein
MSRRRPIAGERGRPRPDHQQVELPEQSERPVEAPEPVEPGQSTEPVGVVEPGEPREPAEPAEPRSRRPRRADALVLLGIAVVVALALTAGLLLLKARGEDRVDQARSQARAAAERHAVTLLSYDHRHLDKDFAAAKKVLTGGFADDYASTTEKVVRPSAEQVKAVVTAQVASSSVVRAAENRVVVLLFVDQTTTSTRLEGPRVDLNRVRMTLDRTGGQWLVSAVDAL